jgi:hypothetical protein
MLLPEPVKIAIATIAVIITALSFIARKRPDVRWLQHFNFQAHLTEEQRERNRRRQNAQVGAELILAGIILPIGYLALKVMFFNAINTMELVAVGILSLICFALGIAAITSRRH